MQCEICGRETMQVKQVQVDGSTLIVCPGCASFGHEVKEEHVKRPAMPLHRIRQPGFKEKEFDLGLGIEPDFGKRIRKAREAKGLTVKELAMKIFEKESLVHRLENQAIKPSDSMIAKLEKELGIQLKGEVE